jgi:hypothetical protein
MINEPSRRVFMSHGMGVVLPIADANKLLEHLLDEMDCWWEALRIDDSGENVERARFKTMREGITWILRYPETLQLAGVALLDAVVLAMELNLLFGTGIAIAEGEVNIPDVWVATQTLYTTPQWCM